MANEKHHCLTYHLTEKIFKDVCPETDEEFPNETPRDVVNRWGFPALKAQDGQKRRERPDAIGPNGGRSGLTTWPGAAHLQPPIQIRRIQGRRIWPSPQQVVQGPILASQ